MLSLEVICVGRSHCTACRDPSRVDWRTSLSHVYALPGEPATFECPHGLPWDSRSIAPEPSIDQADRSFWPALARIYANACGNAGDKGLGDTVARTISGMGGEYFKEVYEQITGADCGCGDRQAALNARFPY